MMPKAVRSSAVVKTKPSRLHVSCYKLKSIQLLDKLKVVVIFQVCVVKDYTRVHYVQEKRS